MLLCLSLSAALAGDLWLDIDAKTDAGQLMLHLPANDLPSSDDDAVIEVNGTTIDLKTEAIALQKKGRGSQRFTLKDTGDDPVVLTLRIVDAPKAEPVTEIVLGLAVGGMGLDLTFPLDDSEDLSDINDKLTGTLEVEGVDLSLSEDDMGQLKRAGPLDLVRLVGPGGGGLTIATR